jgi:hypothetical protein
VAAYYPCTKQSLTSTSGQATSQINSLARPALHGYRDGGQVARCPGPDCASYQDSDS